MRGALTIPRGKDHPLSKMEGHHKEAEPTGLVEFPPVYHPCLLLLNLSYLSRMPTLHQTRLTLSLCLHFLMKCHILNMCVCFCPVNLSLSVQFQNKPGTLRGWRKSFSPLPKKAK